MSLTRLIVGIGNPGTQYAWTRHNMGFLLLHALASQYEGRFRKAPGIEGHILGLNAAGLNIYLLKPLTYVNHSGIAVKACLEKFDLDPSELLVVCDDLNLPFGQMRVRPNGSAGGHNGLKSIIEALDTQAFARLRLGINKVRQREAVVGHVLSEFTEAEKTKLSTILKRAVDCCQVWLNEGINKAMEQFNQRKNDE